MQPNAFLTLAIALLGLGLAAHGKVGTGSYSDLFEILFWASSLAGVIALVWGLFKTIFPPAPVRPDMDIREFIDDWLGFSRWRYNNNRFLVNEISDGANEALTAMAAQARLDHITVWGSKESLIHGTVPLSPIPKEEWDHLSVDYLDFLTAHDTKYAQAKSNRTRGNDPYYIDIHLNRAQVRKQWPRTRWLRRTRKRFAMWRSGL